MILVIDIGNTNTVLGVYNGEALVADWRIESKKQRTADEYMLFVRALMEAAGLAADRFDGAIISSVVPPLTGTFLELVRKLLSLEARVVGPGLKTGMPILYDNPREVGADRIVNSVAAYDRYRQGLIAVDFGTATTFDVISPRGEYLGGAIAPGLGVSHDALFYRASKLPRVELTAPPRAVGKNTVESMQSGLFFGFVALVDGMVRRIQAELDFPTRVIATGGTASLVADAAETIEEVDPALTLRGLKLLYDRNR